MCSRREKERAGTVIDVAPEHVHRRKWIVAAAIAQAGTVAPDDAARFLQRAVEQDQPAADGADIRCACGMCSAERSVPGST